MNSVCRNSYYVTSLQVSQFHFPFLKQSSPISFVILAQVATFTQWLDWISMTHSKYIHTEALLTLITFRTVCHQLQARRTGVIVFPLCTRHTKRHRYKTIWAEQWSCFTASCDLLITDISFSRWALIDFCADFLVPVAFTQIEKAREIEILLS
jgi:hypothetical protein